MPDTGERREIVRFANAKEAETVQDSNKIASKTKEHSAKAAEEDRARKRRTTPPRITTKVPQRTREAGHDRAGSERMADEGDPNP
jgi:hypothetical protein